MATRGSLDVAMRGALSALNVASCEEPTLCTINQAQDAHQEGPWQGKGSHGENHSRVWKLDTSTGCTRLARTRLPTAHCGCGEQEQEKRKTENVSRGVPFGLEALLFVICGLRLRGYGGTAVGYLALAL